jgi:CRISPR-associated endonuclease/helicase Cas3
VHNRIRYRAIDEQDGDMPTANAPTARNSRCRSAFYPQFAAAVRTEIDGWYREMERDKRKNRSDAGPLTTVDHNGAALSPQHQHWIDWCEQRTNIRFRKTQVTSAADGWGSWPRPKPCQSKSIAGRNPTQFRGWPLYSQKDAVGREPVPQFLLLCRLNFTEYSLQHAYALCSDFLRKLVLSVTLLNCHVLWAKSNNAGGYSLPLHLLDVAAVAHTLGSRLPPASRKRVVEDCGCPPAAAPALVALFAGMHDLGKAIPGFQAKWVPGRRLSEQKGFSFSAGELVLGDRHDAFSVRIADNEFKRLGVNAGLRRQVVSAIGAHHGFAIHDAPGTRQLEALAPTWKTAHQELLTLLFKATGVDVAQLQAAPSSGRLREWLSGLISIADWIGSDTTFFPHDRMFTSYEAHWDEALSLAVRALDAIGLPAGAAISAAGVPRNLWMHEILAGRAPRALQLAVMEVFSESAGPVMLIVEAPMGEGKTEAALWASLAQSCAGERGVYFALPTQATANGLAPRVSSFLEKFAIDGTVDVQLVHAGARKQPAGVRPAGIDNGRQDTLSAKWFGQRKRGLLAPVGVGTVDQALIGVLEAKHRFVRLFALADRTVVLDEVHAYDAYTSGLIERLVQWLGALGSSVVLMSATLPTATRDRLVRAWAGSAAEIPTLAYPRLVCARAHEPVFGKSFSASLEKHVALAPLADEGAKELALRYANGGAAVLIVCNTVARAQSRFRDLANGGVQIRLFHARYPFAERSRREAAVINEFGPTSLRPAQGGILVATQVVEQSLDLDFDVLITDLAPADLLLQRIGRLHRHPGRLRPEIAEDPKVYVIGLDAKFGVSRTKLASIYEPGPLARTQALLSGKTSLNIPADIDRLVQAVYAKHFDWPPEFRSHGEAADDTTTRSLNEMSSLANSAALPSPTEPIDGSLRRLLDDDAEVLGTRLGEDSLTMIPIFVFDDEYGATPTKTANWPKDGIIPRGIASFLAMRTVSISNPRVIKAVRSQAADRPRGWHDHAALSDALPWYVYADGRSVHIPGVVYLDDELGVVFEKRDAAA